MTVTIKGISVQTNLTHNVKVRKQIALFIEGKTNNPPSAFLTKGGRIFLCQLSNGEKIYLPSTFPDYYNKPFIVQVLSHEGQIIAKVVPRYKDYQRVERFLVKDGQKIYYEAEPILEENESVQNEGFLSVSKHKLAYEWGRKLQAWWKMETNDPPDQIEKNLSREGTVHLCPFNNEPVSLRIDADHPHEMVTISCDGQDNSRWVIFTLKTGLVKKFWLVEDGKTYFLPKPK
jgi:hypothetical protein